MPVGPAPAGIVSNKRVLIVEEGMDGYREDVGPYRWVKTLIDNKHGTREFYVVQNDAIALAYENVLEGLGVLGVHRKLDQESWEQYPQCCRNEMCEFVGQFAVCDCRSTKIDGGELEIFTELESQFLAKVLNI